ncbi:homoserine kinase [Apilactobacillus xinyiensis]|uniref:homoserine kinase n=1 Tax=Apilactobacillus xinyiensis TaxID=2841032 RepID=UPI0020362D7C|nr:homoserine kinase [Apilactobacillus xinyiensis]
MKKLGKIIVRIPATSANLGPGVNSIGIALKLYYTVIVEEPTSEWRVNHALGENIPHDENNLIVKTILKVNHNIKPHQLTVMSDIPVMHGLGSSTTAIVAGIKIANALGKMNLSLDEQINIGSRMEKHSNNIASAILGDLTISTFDGNLATTVKTTIPKNIKALISIKNSDVYEQLSHNDDKISYRDAVNASSFSNVFVAAIMSNEWSKATSMMELDHFYKYISSDDGNSLNLIRKIAHRVGVHSTYLSGFGSTVVTLGTESELNQIRDALSDQDFQGSLRIIDVASDGAQVRGE